MHVPKIVIYTCGGLMIAATVVGAIDYNHAAKSGRLKNLYKEPEEEKVLHSDGDKDINVEDYSRKAIVYEESDSIPPPPPSPPSPIHKKFKKVAKPPAPKPPKVMEETPDTPVEPKATTHVKKKKIITLKRFGRGPLREMVEEVDDTTPVADSTWNYR